nr:MAG TPA: hypothetical protein [Caudoviricetes sp.]
MEKYSFEFIIHDQMSNQEYEAQKNLAIKTNIEKYLEDIQEYDRFENHSIEGSILNKKIAFELKEERYMIYGDQMTSRIILYPIKINETKIEIPYYPKYTFKERIKILLKGRL